MSPDQQYLDYIKNAGGSVSKKDFVEDWEPIGAIVLIRLSLDRKIRVEDGVVFLRRDDILIDDFEPRPEQPAKSFKPRTRKL